MYDRIKQMIDYVENLLPMGRNAINKVQELLNFIRQVWGSAPMTAGSDAGVTRYSLDLGEDPKVNMTYSDLRAVCDKKLAEPHPTVEGFPTIFLPILLKLAEDFIAKWLHENRLAE